MSKQERPFTDKHWDLMLTGACNGTEWDPKGGFGPGQKPGEISWSMLCDHEQMADGKKSWYHSLSYTDFLRIIVGLEQLANDLDSGEVVREFKFQYYKDGKMNMSGVSLLIGRAANGYIYLSWRNKKIPKVGFWFRSAGTRMVACNGDSQDEDPKIDTRDCVLARTEHWRARYQDWASQTIVKDDYTGSSGGSGSGSQQSSNNNDVDFDDDIPF